jgi:hypothetical protein
MAQVWLSRRDCAEGALPALCLKCGRPATECVERDLAGTLLWCDPVTYLLSVIWGGQSAPVRVPLCLRHRHYWRRRRLDLLMACLLTLLPLFAVLIWCWAASEGDFDVDEPLSLLTVMVCMVFTALFCFVLVYSTSGIRVKEIAEDGILLFGVSLKFAHTYEGEHFLGGIDVDEALDKYGRRPRRRGEDVTDEA